MKKNGRYLIEDYAFNYLLSGRDILRFGKINDQGKKNILFGNPDFDLNIQGKKNLLKKMALKTSKPMEAAWRSPDLRNASFKPLPATHEEVEAIQSILGGSQTEVYSGKQAIEEILFEMETPKILHLATHGFFLIDQSLKGNLPGSIERGILPIKSPSGEYVRKDASSKTKLLVSREQIKNKVAYKNPLLRSGFVLAGANSSLKSGSVESTNGIITAEKISGLNLRGTDLVVLSACQTGLGGLRSGEGIFGLRRAFSMAGAKSIVMSMWKVPDKETKELMVAFYSNLKAGINRNEALRQAALAQKQIVQERYGQAHPFYWGGFIFSGEP